MNISYREAFLGKRNLKPYESGGKWSVMADREWDSSIHGLIPLIARAWKDYVSFYTNQDIRSHDGWFINEERNCIIDLDEISGDKEEFLAKFDELLKSGKFEEQAKSPYHQISIKDFYEL